MVAVTVVAAADVVRAVAVRAADVVARVAVVPAARAAAAARVVVVDRAAARVVVRSSPLRRHLQLRQQRPRQLRLQTLR